MAPIRGQCKAQWTLFYTFLIEILYNFCYLQTVETCQLAHTYTLIMHIHSCMTLIGVII